MDDLCLRKRAGTPPHPCSGIGACDYRCCSPNTLRTRSQLRAPAHHFCQIPLGLLTKFRTPLQSDIEARAVLTIHSRSWSNCILEVDTRSTGLARPMAAGDCLTLLANACIMSTHDSVLRRSGARGATASIAHSRVLNGLPASHRHRGSPSVSGCL